MFHALGSHCSPNLEACHVCLTRTHAAITAPVPSESTPKAYQQEARYENDSICCKTGMVKRPVEKKTNQFHLPLIVKRFLHFQFQISVKLLMSTQLDYTWFKWPTNTFKKDCCFVRFGDCSSAFCRSRKTCQLTNRFQADSSVAELRQHYRKLPQPRLKDEFIHKAFIQP